MTPQIRKIILSTLLATTSLFSMTATFAAPIQDKTIDRLLILSDFKGIIKETNQELKPMFDEQAKAILMDALDTEQLNSKQLVAADKISALMAKMTSDITEDQQFYDLIKSSYKKTFTEEEGLANIAFLETPIGQSINKKTTKLMTDVMQQSQELAEKTLQDPEKKAQFMEEFSKVFEPLLLENN